MSTVKTLKAIDDTVLTPIAREYLAIETLLTRNSDPLDFHDVSVWGVKRALRTAYRAGRTASEPLAETLRILIASCEEALSVTWDRSDSGFQDMIDLANLAIERWEGGAP